MTNYKKGYEAALKIIDRKYMELDYIRRGLFELKARRDWKDIEEVEEFIDCLIRYGE